MTRGHGTGSAQPEVLLYAATPAAPAMHTDLTDSTPTGLAAHSRFFQRLHRRYGAELALLPAGTPMLKRMQETLQALRTRGHDLPSALRILRQLVMERLIRLDCEDQAPATAPPADPTGSPWNCGSSAWASWARANSTYRVTST